MERTQLQTAERFVVSQKLTVTTNQYVVSSVQPDGSAGEVVAFAQQELMALKDQVIIYTDESRDRVLCTFEADKVLDVGAVHTVRDEDGNPIGSFREKILTSLLRSTWVLDQPGLAELTGRERNAALAVLRRIWDFLAGHRVRTVRVATSLRLRRRWQALDGGREEIRAARPLSGGHRERGPGPCGSP